MDKDIHKFKSMQLKASLEQEEINKRIQRVKESTSYVKIHLKDNIKLYKMKSDSINSSRRNAYIISLLEEGFNEFDHKSISFYLSRKGLLTGFQFFMLMAFVIYPLVIVALCHFFSQVIVVHLAMLLVVVCVILLAIYTESNKIKLYF